jgi:hypothetical protein
MAVFSRVPLLKVRYGIGHKELNKAVAPDA